MLHLDGIHSLLYWLSPSICL